MNKLRYVIIFLLVTIAIYWVVNQFLSNDPVVEQSNLEILTPVDTLNFQKATEIRAFSFPEDYGAHDQFLTEWWYYTGNLVTENNRHFGYQLTFFRRAISANSMQENSSNWNTNQIYLAHFAITNTEGREHYVADQVARGTNNLSGTKVYPLFSIWLYDWKIEQVEEDIFLMKAEDEQFAIEFRLTNLKDEIFHGNRGLSQKGEDKGNASYYFSQTRLETVGRLRVENEWFDVSGLSWMDHEFGTSTLGKQQVGWDWFSMQFENQTEIMLFQIRNEDGSISEFSSGTFVNSVGESQSLIKNDFLVQVIDTWKNSQGFDYPAGWIISIEELEIDLEITPVIKNQEMSLYFQYWEGAVIIEGTMNGEAVKGYGYVELTGYVQSMQGVF